MLVRGGGTRLSSVVVAHGADRSKCGGSLRSDRQTDDKTGEDAFNSSGWFSFLLCVGAPACVLDGYDGDRNVCAHAIHDEVMCDSYQLMLSVLPAIIVLTICFLTREFFGTTTVRSCS